MTIKDAELLYDEIVAHKAKFALLRKKGMTREEFDQVIADLDDVVTKVGILLSEVEAMDEEADEEATEKTSRDSSTSLS